MSSPFEITQDDKQIWEHQVKTKGRLFLSKITLSDIDDEILLKWLGSNNFYMIHTRSGGVVKSF